MRAARTRTPLPWPLLLAAALLLGFLLLPFLALLGALPQADRSAFVGADTRSALGVSLVAATVAVLIDGLLGVPLGLWLAQTGSRLRHLVTALVLLPLAVPPVVGGLEIVLLAGPNGWLGGPLARLGLDPLDTIAGTILAQMFVAAPYVVISARAAFGGVDPNMVDAARSLGSRPGQVFRRVMVPAARAGLAAGLVLGWVRSMGEFGATAVVAYHPYTLPTLTYVNLSGEGLKTALPTGALLAAVGAATAAVILWLDSRRGRGRAQQVHADHPAMDRPLAWVTPEADWDAAPLEVRAVARFGDFELDVAFESAAPSVAILGPSGAGKSLTLRTIAGLIQPHFGVVVVGGRRLLDTAAGLDLPAERRKLGYVAQRDGLFEHMDVEHNIAYALKGLPERERRSRVEELLSSLGLARVRSARPQTLSGGERQRTALGRALASGPSALLLDEPFSNVDVVVRRELRNLVRAVHERTGLPIVLVTHDREDVLDLSDYVIVLEGGTVVQQGWVEEVFARPASRSVAQLVGIPNVLAVHELRPGAGGRVRALTGWGELSVEAPEMPAIAWELAVPPDAISVDLGRGPFSVVAARRAEAAWRVSLSDDAQLLEALIPRGAVVRPPAPGDSCTVQIDGSRCHLMAGGRSQDSDVVVLARSG